MNTTKKWILLLYCMYNVHIFVNKSRITHILYMCLYHCCLISSVHKVKMSVLAKYIDYEFYWFWLIYLIVLFLYSKMWFVSWDVVYNYILRSIFNFIKCQNKNVYFVYQTIWLIRIWLESQDVLLCIDNSTGLICKLIWFLLLPKWFFLINVDNQLCITIITTQHNVCLLFQLEICMWTEFRLPWKMHI